MVLKKQGKPLMTDFVPVFDGHNDIVLKIAGAGAGRMALWLDGAGAGHLDLPRMQAAGFAGGLFAVWIPSPETGDLAALERLMDSPPYDLPLPEMIDDRAALPVAMEMLGHLLWMERAAMGRFRWCRTAGEIRAAMAGGMVAGVLHFEGAEAIGPDLDALHVFHAMGLRSLGPVWSRPTIFGHGVPFRYPSTGDTGPGLTEAGKALVRECNSLRILIDLSHLNEAGFWDVAGLSDAPLVATHSNAHAVCPSSRNLTDSQLRAIGQSGGIAGLNLATCFLRPDGRESPAMTLDPVKRHIEHMLGMAGEDHVGIGSDFDGATVPEGIAGVEGLPVLVQAMRDMGLGEALILKIAHGNWLRVLERTWGA
jgi:membrane dipeptidase